MYWMKECPYCNAEIQEAAIACPTCGRDLQEPERALASAWELSAPAAIVLTLLSTCGIAVYVDNEFEAIRGLALDLPVTFFFWWLVCTFMVRTWRGIAAAIDSLRQGQVAAWLKNLLS